MAASAAIIGYLGNDLLTLAAMALLLLQLLTNSCHTWSACAEHPYSQGIILVLVQHLGVAVDRPALGSASVEHLNSRDVYLTVKDHHTLCKHDIVTERPLHHALCLTKHAQWLQRQSGFTRTHRTKCAVLWPTSV